MSTSISIAREAEPLGLLSNITERGFLGLYDGELSVWCRVEAFIMETFRAAAKKRYTRLDISSDFVDETYHALPEYEVSPCRIARPMCAWVCFERGDEKEITYRARRSDGDNVELSKNEWLNYVKAMIVEARVVNDTMKAKAAQ